MMTWSKGEEYGKNSLSQEIRAKTALKGKLRHGIDVLDIGCGDGKITEYMANQVDYGFVMAFDISKSMVRKAYSQSNTSGFFSVIQDDAVDFKIRCQFDLITSFFCLQWLPKKQLPAVFANIAEHLKPNGQICILLPCYDFPHIVINNVAHNKKWQVLFKNYQEKQNIKESIVFYENLLYKLKMFEHIKVQIIKSDHKISVEDFIEFTRQWCGCYHHLLDDALNQDFINDVKQELNNTLDGANLIEMQQETIHIAAGRQSLTNAFNLTQFIESKY